MPGSRAGGRRHILHAGRNTVHAGGVGAGRSMDMTMEDGGRKLGEQCGENSQSIEY